MSSDGEAPGHGGLHSSAAPDTPPGTAAVALAATASSTELPPSAVMGAASAAANAQVGAPEDTAGEPLLKGIARLKAEQANLRAERKRVQKELKNAEKRRARLRKRARQLSDADLVAVLQMRETAAAPTTPALCSAGSSSSASAPATTAVSATGAS